MSGRRARNVDAETSRPRVQPRRRRQPPPPPPPQEATDYSSQSDSDLEEELEIAVRDDTRRQRTQRPAPRSTRQSHQQAPGQQSATQPGPEPEKEERIAPHMLITAALYHLSFAPIVFPTVSKYKPSSYAMFAALDAMHSLVASNTYLNYVCPDYVTLASRAYYGIMFFMQVLRAMDAAKIITRPQSQMLRRFTRTYPLEQLVCASPLIGYFQNLGTFKPADPMYDHVTPFIPDTIGTDSTTNGCFNRSDNIMLPCIPALVEFIRQIGSAVTVASRFNLAGQLIPHTRTNGTFLGMNLSNNQTNSADWQSLVHSAGWTLPSEVEADLTMAKLIRIGRWNVPTTIGTTNLSTLDGFLRLEANESIDWFKNLSRIAAQEAKFFKGSTNFSKIGDQSTLSALVESRLSGPSTRPTGQNEYYPTNRSPLLATNHSARGETSPELFRFGAVTQLNSSFGDNFVPATTLSHPRRETSGPYFHITDAGTTHPASTRVWQIESLGEANPTVLLGQVIVEHMFDQTGQQSSGI